MKLLRLCAVLVLTFNLAGCSTSRPEISRLEKTEEAVAQIARTETSTARFEASLRSLGAKIIPGRRIGGMVAVIPPPPFKGGGRVTAVCVNYYYLPDDRFAYESITRMELDVEP
jgi:hypothetical protein